MKKFINENYINRVNKLNSRKMANMDQITKDIIMSFTVFLPEDAPLKERMYCILRDIKERQLCEFCGTQRRFIFARNIYVRTCGSHICSAKLRELRRKTHK